MILVRAFVRGSETKGKKHITHNIMKQGKIVVMAAAILAAGSTQAVPMLDISVDEPGDLITLHLAAVDVGVPSGTWALDGHYIINAPAVNVEYRRLISAPGGLTLNPNPIPDYFGLGEHLVEFTYTGGVLEGNYTITTVPRAPGEPDPSSVPDGGSTAMLLAPALGLLAFRRK